LPLLPVAAVPGPPSAPEVCNVVSTKCTVRYQLPSDEGNAPVTGYHVQRHHVLAVGDDSGWEAVNEQPITALEIDVDHLQPLSRYEFRVAAKNELGTGDFSPASRLITTDNSVRTTII